MADAIKDSGWEDDQPFVNDIFKSIPEKKLLSLD